MAEAKDADIDADLLQELTGYNEQALAQAEDENDEDMIQLSDTEPVVNELVVDWTQMPTKLSNEFLGILLEDVIKQQTFDFMVQQNNQNNKDKYKQIISSIGVHFNQILFILLKDKLYNLAKMEMNKNTKTDLIRLLFYRTSIHLEGFLQAKENVFFDDFSTKFFAKVKDCTGSLLAEVVLCVYKQYYIFNI